MDGTSVVLTVNNVVSHTCPVSLLGAGVTRVSTDFTNTSGVTATSCSTGSVSGVQVDTSGKTL